MHCCFLLQFNQNWIEVNCTDCIGWYLSSSAILWTSDFPDALPHQSQLLTASVDMDLRTEYCKNTHSETFDITAKTKHTNKQETRNISLTFHSIHLCSSFIQIFMEITTKTLLLTSTKPRLNCYVVLWIMHFIHFQHLQVLYCLNQRKFHKVWNVSKTGLAIDHLVTEIRLDKI